MIAAPISRVLAFAVVFAIGVSVTPARAVDATWFGPADWSNNLSWIPATVPDNTATFTNNGASPIVPIINPGFAININTIQFTAAAPTFTFNIAPTANFIINGTGIVNNSSNSPSFNNQESRKSRDDERYDLSYH
jgi:hypothetical protein